MQQIPSLEASSSSARQEIPHLLQDPSSQQSTIVSALGQINPDRAPPSYFQVVTVPQVSPPKLCMHLSSTP
jgi:hypothetical protein